MSAKKPPPLVPRRTHERCPVCGEISYSLGGVHPQCSVQQADAMRLEKLKRDKKSKAEVKPAIGAKPWQRVCPKCKALQHVRKKVCGCGYTFTIRARPPTTEGEQS